jgi:hypothetical protein
MSRAIHVVLIIVIGCLILPVSSSPASAADTAELPKWSVGDYWIYEGSASYVHMNMSFNVTGEDTVTVNGQKYEVFTVKMHVQYRALWFSGTLDDTTHFRKSDYAEVQSAEYDPGDEELTTTVYDPPKKDLDFPLMLDKEWNQTVTEQVERIEGGMTTKYNTTTTTYYEVDDIEWVNISLGSFKCFRVHVMEVGEDDNYNYFSERVGNYVWMTTTSGSTSLTLELQSYKYKGPKGGGSDDGDIGGFLMSPLFMVIIVVLIVVVVVAVIGYMMMKPVAGGMYAQPPPGQGYVQHPQQPVQTHQTQDYQPPPPPT